MTEKEIYEKIEFESKRQGIEVKYEEGYTYLNRLNLIAISKSGKLYKIFLINTLHNDFLLLNGCYPPYSTAETTWLGYDQVSKIVSIGDLVNSFFEEISE